MSLLQIEGIDVFYRDAQALCQVSLEVEEGEIVSLVGANGTGKSTLLRTISGLLHPTTKSGSILFAGQIIQGMPPHRIVETGLIQVPEARRLFPFMTVQENLELGSYNRRARSQAKEAMERVFQILPLLRERRGQIVRSLSGGEQQMLAIGRGLMARPLLLMLDEPSLGLAPMVVQELFSLMGRIRNEGVTILLVEQDVRRALKIADRGYVLDRGRITMKGRGQELLDDPRIKVAYLGI
jgi:branched-chain amino acid transport system ATP-binding protein